MAKVKGAVEVDIESCKGCDLCVFACPYGVLALSKSVNKKGYPYSYMLEPDACIGCANCGYICPDGCIRVYKIKK